MNLMEPKNVVSLKITKKIRTLQEIAMELRLGKDFSITRLTLLKEFCNDAQAAAQFALHLAKKTQQAMLASQQSSSEKKRQYLRLIRNAVGAMAAYLRQPSKKTAASLTEILSEAQNAQNRFEHQQWGPVRIIESRELLIVETALKCLLQSWESSDLGYRVARQYAERYNPRYGTGLIPESASMVEDITEFWGRHFLGRGWRRRLEI